ncbi:MAG: Atxe2 family lasso peptide isopeptidase [Sphingopyxis sp.]|uniref:Atxe2 family lasso peptide isopeptidase n=1 Tax=Sphingopyxis sp. TaxID=1908224 RepID=UPI001A2F8D78|nr:Atxe2 family lasso peptide isopeptidase [Sphingopyxis sp.]MBJ7501001.1 Atxe2 family lasso peptide isopeptidase [Sphingopyxis sp.]
MVTAWLLAGAATAGLSVSSDRIETESERRPVSERDLVEAADISGLRLSPDGLKLAYRVSRPSIEKNETMLDWYVVDVAGIASPTRIGGGIAQHGGAGTLLEQSPVWDRDSLGLRFRAFDGEAAVIWHWRSGSIARRELVDAADILAFEVSADGQSIRYSVGATRAEILQAERDAYANGALVDRHLDLMEPVAGGTIEGGKRIMQRLPSAWFNRERLLSRTPKKEIVVQTRGANNIPAKDPPDFTPELSEQGVNVLAESGSRARLASEGISTLRVIRKDGQTIDCTVAICRSPQLAALAWRPGRDELLLFERTGSARETIWLWRVGAPGARVANHSDGATRSSAHTPRCAVGIEALFCAEAGPVSPPHVVRLGYDGKRTILADPNAALRMRIDARATPMSWARGVTGVLLQPANMKMPVPLVVQYYRCSGFLKGGVGDEIPMLPLVEHGIAVMCMDRVRAEKEAGTGESYRLALSDIQSALDQLVNQGVVDPARVGIGGLSFGSEVTLYAIRKTNRFAAATIASSQMTPSYFWANALPGRGFAEMLEEYWKIGDPDSDPKRWRELSAVYDIGSINTPLLMQLPEAEARHVAELHTRMKRAGKAVDFFAFADEPHIKKQPIHKLAVYRRNLDWYRFWLKGDEDPDPAKAEQYQRWRAYRAAQAGGEQAR